MNATQRGIITLLKSAVLEQGLPLPGDFDLQEAYPLLKRHHMSTLIYDGAVRCGIPAGEPVMRQLFQNYCRLLLISERQMQEVGRIFAAFEAAGIDYMPLKGCVMKARYPKPELRIMGDADILIRLEQYDRIVPIMEQLGFARGKESDHELVWRSEGLYAELHKRLIPSYNRDFHTYFGDSWAFAKCRDGYRWSMTPEDEAVYLFTHYAKHFRDGGIGCRHVTDLWVFFRSHPELDETAVRNQLERLQLLKFYELTRRMIGVWFEDEAGDDLTDFLTDYVFASGSWGAVESRVISTVVRDSTGTPVGFNGRLTYLWRTFFQSADVLKDKYTVLQKAPWLLPVVWIYRPFYKVLFEWRTLKKQKRNLRALGEAQVDERRQMLHEIGLDYNF